MLIAKWGKWRWGHLIWKGDQQEGSVHRHFINGCQFKIILYAFKLASLKPCLREKNFLIYQLKNEVRKVNFNTYKRIYNWQPFMKRIYSSSNKGDGDKTFWSFRPYTWFSWKRVRRNKIRMVSSTLLRSTKWFYLLRFLASCGIVRYM